MTDFARLGIEIDSRSAKGAASDLDKLTAAGARAEAATVGIGRGSKAAGAAAAAMAVQAQVASRSAVGMAGGANTASLAMQSLGKKTSASSLQIRESLVLMREASVGNFTRMAGSASILAGSLATTGSNVGALAKQLLIMVGVLKVTQDAELAEIAVQAAVARASVEAVAQRAASAIAAADTEVALAEAAVRVAATSEAASAAQLQLAAAHEAVTAAAAEATIAENALAAAEGRAGQAAAASAAATTIALGPIVGVLAGLGIAVGAVVGGFKVFQAQTHDSGEKFANSLGLTTKEMKRLRQEVGGFSAKEMQDLDTRARAFEVTWGDVMHGVAKTARDALDLSPSWQKFKSDAADAFSSVLSGSVTAASYMKGVWGASIGTILGQLASGWHGGGAVKLADDFWKDVGDRAAAAQKQISGNLKIINDNILGARDKRIKGPADAIIADRTPKKVSDHGLADALATLDAQIKGQLALAAAYQVSDAAAIKAEALQKAEEQAIRHKGEVGIFYTKELALAVAKGSAEAGRQIADLSAQTAAQKAVNDAVSAGVLDAERASEVLESEAQIRPHLAEYAVAEGKAKDDLANTIERLRKEQTEANFQAARAQVLADTAAGSDQLERLKLEGTLIGATNAVRAVAIAQLEAEQFLRKNPGASAEEAQKYLDTQKAIAEQTADNATAQDNYNNSLSYMAELLGLIDQQAQTMGSALASAFGGVGQGVATALTALTSYAATQAKIDEDHHKAQLAAGNDAKALAAEEILYAKKSDIAKQQATMQTISGLKGLFKEHSAGYKVMTAIEKAYAILQLVNTVKSIALDTAKTGSSIANSAARAAADGIAAIAKAIASLPFPLNIAAGAATAAALIAFGVKVFGGSGGGGGKAPTSADDVQAAQGTGTVLGDASAKSESIANSLELVAANTNKSLEFFNPMLRALRSIDTNIGALAAQVAKELQLGGAFDTTGKLGTTSKGISGLFGSTTTKSLYDQGLQFNPTNLADAITNGISGATYQIIEKSKKSSGFLGIGGGTKTSYSTTTGALDPEMQRQVGLILGSLRDSVVEAAKVLGLDVQAALNTFQVEIGKISFADMSADEITKALEAVFSKVADQMAGFAVAGLEQFQKAGEGLFETLTRLAKDYTTIDVALKSIGKTFGSVGTASIAARESLIALFGSLEAFVDQTAFYQQNFLTDAQQIAAVQTQVRSTLSSLGLSSVDTIAEFKSVVDGIDLTTTAGQALYAQLMALAPAFYQVEQYEAQQAAAAAALAKQKAQMQVQLLQAQGKAEEALAAQRKLELAALDPSLRALQQQIYTAQDIASAKDKLAQAYQRERTELEATINKFGDLSKSLRAYRDTLFGGGAGSLTYNSALAKLISTGSLASAGDATALGDLPGVGKSFLDIAKDRAGTLQQYQRDVALVARYVDQGITASDSQKSVAERQLAAMTDQVGKLIDLNASVLSVKDAILALNKLVKPPVSPPSGSGSGGSRPPRPPRERGSHEDKVEQRLDEMAAAITQLAVTTTQQTRLLKTWDGGGAMTIKTDDDTPLVTTPAT